MDTLKFSVNWTVAQLPNNKYIAVAIVGGITLRGNVCNDPTEASRSLFQLLGGMHNSTDADIAISLHVSGTSMAEIAQLGEGS